MILLLANPSVSLLLPFVTLYHVLLSVHSGSIMFHLCILRNFFLDEILLVKRRAVEISLQIQYYTQVHLMILLYILQIMQSIGFLGPAFFLTQLSHVRTPALAVLCMACSQVCFITKKKRNLNLIQVTLSIGKWSQVKNTPRLFQNEKEDLNFYTFTPSLHLIFSKALLAFPSPSIFFLQY